MNTLLIFSALFSALFACSRPGGAPSVNGDPDRDWPALPELDSAIVEIMDDDRIAGLSACLIDGGAVVWCGGYGDADPDAGRPATPSTPFLLASVSKAVAAVAVMQAVEDGALSMDAPVDEVLPFDLTHPDSPNIEITTRHLMTHTSGLIDNWDRMEPHYVDGDSDLALGDFLEGYLTPAGADYDSFDNFHPDGVGSAYEYSNVGAALVGYAVEAAEGTAFDDYCDANLFGPLGMNAGWHLADFDADEVARPTQARLTGWEVLEHYGFPDYPNGQLRADAYSMGRFVAAIANGGALDGAQVLSESTVNDMLSEQIPELEEGQGLMWYGWEIDGQEVVGHNGGEVGASTEILIRRSDDRGVVVLMNSEGRAGTLEDVELAILTAADDL